MNILVTPLVNSIKELTNNNKKEWKSMVKEEI